MMNKSPIAWMAKNRVAANLLMLFFLIGGLLFAYGVKQEVFPEFTVDMVRVTVAYPGASPEEVEEGIVLAIEDEVRSLEGIKTVTSRSFEGEGIVTAEILTGADQSKVLQDIKNSVDKIQSFPEEAERPIVRLLDLRRQVISVIVSGKIDQRFLRSVAEGVRDDLLQMEGITLVDLAGVPAPEVSIEIPRQTLRAYNLRLSDVADTIRRTAFDLPGGGIKTPRGEVLLRTEEKRDYADEYADIAVVSRADGTEVKLEEIATLKETYEESDEETFFNGNRAVRVDVFRVGEQNPIEISETVRNYIQAQTLPKEITLTAWNDSTEIYRDRIHLLLKNASIGLLLVLILLGLFLEPTLAFWVTLGIPISIIGSFAFISLTGASINMISLFAFIVTLGIIVDDAVLVGENIFYKREKGLSLLQAAIKGAQQMAMPVFFAVATNIVAFTPLLFVGGIMGKLFFQIPAIVIAVFVVSLVESLFILPAHLSHIRKVWGPLNAPNRWFEAHLKKFIENIFTPTVSIILHYRYLTWVISFCLIGILAAFYTSGRIAFSYLPKVDSDLVTAQATLPYGASIESARSLQKKLVEGVKEVLSEIDDPNISRGVLTQIGSPLYAAGPGNVDVPLEGSHLVGAQVFLIPAGERTITGIEFANLWREKVGEALPVETIQFRGVIQTARGEPIEIQLSHKDIPTLEEASEELASRLRAYAGVIDIDDGVAKAKPQINFKLKPEARSLNLTAKDLADQVRHAFYGAEALRLQRGRDEVKVFVRLPEEERKELYTLDDFILRNAQGNEIPLKEAAQIDYGKAYSDIKRDNGRRILTVKADVDEALTNANEVLADVIVSILPNLVQKYPGLTFSFEGEQREQRESLESLQRGFLVALLIIYILLAVPFKSYAQPLIVMLSIPFGVIGAVIGHLLLGYELSIISLFGIIALSGVVINDSLILVVTINENLRERKMPLFDAVVQGAKRRFRPIILTSLTTFFGLSPMIFETSMQARFLIPMAISLGFGILFATGITLFLTTSMYLILKDVKGGIKAEG